MEFNLTSFASKRRGLYIKDSWCELPWYKMLAIFIYLFFNPILYVGIAKMTLFRFFLVINSFKNKIFTLNQLDIELNSITNYS